MDDPATAWEMIEGRIPGEWETRSPTASQIIGALEAVAPDMDNPYVILEAPAKEPTYSNYCQALAFDEGYCCEIRQYGATADAYIHYRLLRPDEHGQVGYDDDDEEFGYHPDLQTVTAVFCAFQRDPETLPVLEPWQWIDVTEQVDGES